MCFGGEKKYDLFMLTIFVAATVSLRWRIAGKRCNVCHVYAKTEQLCLAAVVVSRYPADAVVWFLVDEAALHGGRAQCPDYSSGCANGSVLFL